MHIAVVVAALPRFWSLEEEEARCAPWGKEQKNSHLQSIKQCFGPRCLLVVQVRFPCRVRAHCGCPFYAYVVRCMCDGRRSLLPSPSYSTTSSRATNVHTHGKKEGRRRGKLQIPFGLRDPSHLFAWLRGRSRRRAQRRRGAGNFRNGRASEEEIESLCIGENLSILCISSL